MWLQQKSHKYSEALLDNPHRYEYSRSILEKFTIMLRKHCGTKLFLTKKLIFLIIWWKKLWRLTLSCTTGPEIVSCNLFLKSIFSSFNPFDTSVLVFHSQVKISKKTLFLRFSWKVPYNVILTQRIQISNSFSQIFSSSSSFLSQLVKKWLPKRVKMIFLGFFWKFPYMVFFQLNNRGIYLKTWLFRGRLIKRGIYLQIWSIVGIGFFFETKPATEKPTNLHCNLFICFILDHIHFFTSILFMRGRNEWIYGITFIN